MPGPTTLDANVDHHAGDERLTDSTLYLLERAQCGDAEALNRLVARYLPRLRRWAAGRLPRWARDLADTQDLVQETVVRAFRKIEGFEPRGEGALQAYLRQILLNRIREELRRAGRQPGRDPLDEDRPSDEASPLEQAIGRQGMERYEQALERLKPQDREAIVTRIELGCSFDEVAIALGKPNANAARSAVNRALVRLVEAMRDGRRD
jgi:RNA polymerase sigma-70 factor (ECF subfamily)